jgi:hypothetical protein
MDNSVQQQGLTLCSRPILRSNSASFGNFSANANESHFDVAGRRLNSPVNSFVSFSDPCNKVPYGTTYRDLAAAMAGVLEDEQQRYDAAQARKERS